MKEDIIYFSGPNRQYKKCFCCVCETIQICTPINDFYTTEKYGLKLICEHCMQLYAQNLIKNKK